MVVVKTDINTFQFQFLFLNSKVPASEQEQLYILTNLQYFLFSVPFDH